MLNPDSPFASWILSEQEMIQGSLFTSLQKRIIQNSISSFAQQLIAFPMDPDKPLVFLQHQAKCQGAIDALSYLLALSAAAESANPHVSQRIPDINPSHNPLINQAPDTF